MNAEAGAHLHRARAAQHEQRAVDDVVDDEDVERVAEQVRAASGSRRTREATQSWRASRPAARVAASDTERLTQRPATS